MSDEPQYSIGSGNVFADLDYSDPDEAMLKAELAGCWSNWAQIPRWEMQIVARH